MMLTNEVKAAVVRSAEAHADRDILGALGTRKVPGRLRPFACGSIDAARGCHHVRLHGCHVFPDSVVLGKGEDPQWLYTVCFEGRELWGDNAEPGMIVSIDAFEPYLEPA